ncbi:MAG TPA: amidohydrolase family protein, partial [Kiloniellaceae bacterium]|nr:amidohydrolase family protein [Kiloniellaceae bacterium]
MADGLLVRGKWLVTGGGDADRVLTDAAVFVTGDRVREVGDWQKLRKSHPDADVLGSDRVAVMPGLINAHHHSSGVSALQHGLADDLLEPWILAHHRRRASDLYLDTLLSAARLLRSGVTAVVDVHSGSGSAEVLAQRLRRALRAYDEAGLRVAFACGVSDQSHLVHGAGEDGRFLEGLSPAQRDDAAALLPSNGEAIDQDDYFAVMAELWRDHRTHSRIEMWYGPPGPQWVSDSFWERIAAAAKDQDTGIQTHVNESIYEKLHGPRFYGTVTLRHLQDLGVLSPRFSLAHGVWLNEEEIGILADSGAAVSHNPSSNL